MCWTYHLPAKSPGSSFRPHLPHTDLLRVYDADGEYVAVAGRRQCGVYMPAALQKRVVKKECVPVGGAERLQQLAATTEGRRCS